MKYSLTRHLLKETYNYDSSKDPIQNVKDIKSLGLNMKDSIAALNTLTIGLNPIMTSLSDQLSPMKSHTDSNNSFSASRTDQDGYTVYLDHKDVWKEINKNNLNANHKYPKLADGASTSGSSALAELVELVKGSVLDLQSALNFLEDTSHVESTADGHEVFAALICKLNFPNTDFTVTAKTSKGVDVKAENNLFTIEVKGSTKETPQTMFSGTLPKNSNTHFYIFLCTDQSYLVRSDLLRAFYLVYSGPDEEGAESFYKKGMGDDDAISAEDIAKYNSFVSFLTNLDTSDDFVNKFTTTSYNDFISAIEDSDTDDNVRLLYDKVLSEIESQSEVLAATLTQALLGVEKTRVPPPNISVGGFYIYLRPNLKGEKESGPRVQELTVDLGGSSSVDVYTSKTGSNMGLKKGYLNKVKNHLRNKIIEPLKSKYGFYSANANTKVRILNYLLNKLPDIDDDLKASVVNQMTREYCVAMNAKIAAPDPVKFPANLGGNNAYYPDDSKIRVYYNELINRHSGMTAKINQQQEVLRKVVEAIGEGYTSAIEDVMQEIEDKLEAINARRKRQRLYETSKKSKYSLLNLISESENDLVNEKKHKSAPDRASLDYEEDQKIQERRRIYELGESHASLLRKKYYGRR